MNIIKRTATITMKNATSGSLLKWKLFILFFTLMGLFTGICTALFYVSINKSIGSARMETLRTSSSSLIDAGENYYMGSITKKEFESKMEKFFADNKLAFVLFTDGQEDLLGFVGEKKIEDILNDLKPMGKRPRSTAVNLNAGGQACLTITETTNTTPPYNLYVGVPVKQIKAQTAKAFLAGPVLIVPLCLFLSLVALVGCFFFVRPYETLAKKAERISMGDLNVPLELESSCEVGSLSRSFDRMRQSVRYALERLEKND
jgi:methyl-accepting chemotaxis protein